MGLKAQPGSRDRRIVALAERQYGLVTRQQLVQLGCTRALISHWLRRRRLRHVHRGVYALGHRILTQHGIWIAGVMAVPGSALSHLSAAQLWDLRDKGPSTPHVTAPFASRKPSVRCHKAPLEPGDTTRCQRIPVTTVARTLFDVAAMLGRDNLERAFDRAELKRRLDLAAIEALIERHPRRHGVPTLRQIIAARAPRPSRTRSGLEDLFLALVRQEGLPRPRVNAMVGPFEVDFTWPERRLGVELDSWSHHGGRGAFERDRARDRRLASEGWNVIRITWRQLAHDPDEVARDLRLLHAQPAA
jgi:very-short-patch-repair endonuclease